MQDASSPPRGPVLWLAAFVGFYRPTEETIRELDPVARFLYAARSVILVISAQAAAIAGLLAATDGRFNPVAFVLVLLGFLAAHAISNLSNDYFGYRRGHDTPDSPRMRYTVHPMTNGVVGTRTLATGLAILTLLGLGIAAYFTAVRGPLALGFAAVGAALLYLYDAAPIPLKSIGLGEVASFLVWGPLMVGGGYYVITGRLSAAAFLASVPYGLGVMSILLGKHIDQLDFDLGAGQRTLPVLLGEATARRVNQAVVVSMYVIIAALVLFGALTPFAALVVLAAPRAINALRLMKRPRPESPPAGYVGWPLWYHRACLRHNRLFGWLYLCGLALGAIWSAVA
ncbi:1,4-dihydroxy-2-naphthoate polyprenyltransferase [soil metagenome]